MNDEIMNRMDLICVYDKYKINKLISDACYYVYVIDTCESYYVGSTKNLRLRIDNHLRSNKNNIKSNGGKIWGKSNGGGHQVMLIMLILIIKIMKNLLNMVSFVLL